jgi:tetratricopeptide (TPR) repeat protein
MYEWIYLGLALLIFLIGLGIGVKLLTRSIREQEEYERRLQSIATPVSGASPPAETPAPEAPPAVKEAPAPPVVKVRAPAVEPAPSVTEPAQAGGVAEADAKAKVKSTRALIDQMKSEGVDISQADKLLQLAQSTLMSGDYERAIKYATKAAKVAKDQKGKGAEAAPAPAAAGEGEDQQQKEVVALISAVQGKLGKVKEESVEKSEVENLLRLATSFVRSKSYAKALRYAKQAEEKAAAMTK